MSGQRIVLAAAEAAGIRALDLLARSAHEVVAVAGRRPADESAPSVLARADALGVPQLDARRLRTPDVVEELRALRPDVLINVHSLTRVCPEVLDVFPTGAWNLHPGPLPEGAGINVPSWAIALGWEEHGVSLHRMTAEYDEGPISYEDRFPIGGRATGLTLSAECASRGLRLVRELIDQLASDPAAVPARAQDRSRRGYFGLGQPGGGIVDWELPAATIDAHVRAADFRPFPSPWQPPRALVDGAWFELVAVELGDSTSEPPGTCRRAADRIAVAAADRWVALTEARLVWA